ncbi:glycosyltransferase family 9 protein [Alphaproteobacteria bacterium]|nr:glycosyltransferase family 9 protein [Alphaproteobacteria bacterium]
MAVLFISATPLGDGILSTGILHALHQRYPDQKISVACGALPAPLFKPIPYVERVIVLKKGPRLQHWRHLWKETVCQKWTAVVDLRGSALAYLLWTKNRYRWQRHLHQSAAGQPLHKVAQLARVLGIEDQPPSPRLAIDDLLREKLCKRFSLTPHAKDAPPIIALGPTSSWPMKEWPLERFQSLATSLQQTSSHPPKFLILTGPGAERERAMPLLHHLGQENCIDGAGTLAVDEAAALLSLANLYVGNDSGLMHMAAALSVPTLGLFGPSPDTNYRPWGEKTAFCRTRTPFEVAFTQGKQGQSVMAEIDIAQIMKTLTKIWP